MPRTVRRWPAAVSLVLTVTLSLVLTLVLFAYPSADSLGREERFGVLILAVLCVLGWWSTFRAGRALIRPR